MKAEIEARLEHFCRDLQSAGELPADWQASLRLSVPKQRDHGDFATNLALMLAKPLKQPPRAIAERLQAYFADYAGIERIEIAGPGFVNFFIRADAAFALIDEIRNAGAQFGQSTVGQSQRVLLEYVSANPTGPLHVGHGRGAAYGSVLANLLVHAGFKVESEYYVNDAGRQMHILAASVWVRYLERVMDEPPAFPSAGYRSEDYIMTIARQLAEHHGSAMAVERAEIEQGLPKDAPEGDADAYVDALIARMQDCLGQTAYQQVFQAALNYILDDIRDDLTGFGVRFDHWYSEQSLADSDKVNAAIDRLQSANYLYEQDGALWFKATEFGDDKDRVVRRENGQTTYFASDIAYHLDKYERGYDLMIDLWGADHHGYVARVKAAMQALGKNTDQLSVSLVQFAILYRGSERLSMSTRSGSFVTLRQLREEVGSDAARFFYVMRAATQHLDFDLELATRQSNENPLYYIQYAHARVHSVFRQLPLRGFAHDPELGRTAYDRLLEPHEQALFKRLSGFPALIERAALAREPHQLVHYLRDLAQDFHSYYNAHAFLLQDDPALRNARLNLIDATRQVLANGLHVLGVTAPDEM